MILFSTLQTNKPTHNGRIYPTKTLKKAVSEIQKTVKARRFFILGECPIKSEEDTTIQLSNIIGLVEKMQLAGNRIKFDAKIFNKDLSSLIRNNRKQFTLNIAGDGNLDPKQPDVVNELHLACVFFNL